MKQLRTLGHRTIRDTRRLVFWIASRDSFGTFESDAGSSLNRFLEARFAEDAGRVLGRCPMMRSPGRSGAFDEVAAEESEIDVPLLELAADGELTLEVIACSP